MSLWTLKNIIRGLVFTFILSACEGRENKEILNPLYFDINGLITSQISLLDSLKPGLNKSLTFDKVTEEQASPKVNWQQELEIFKEADINSPVLRETYQVKEEKGKRTTTIHYLPIEDKNKGVVKLSITYDANKKLKSIHCKITSNNWLYSFERDLELFFSNEKNLELLQGFSIKNSQEILFKKKDQSKLKANIIFSS
ncbi:MAG TPA: hypothetical protein VD908_12045 [Cytophagales bacterium]|nr:hypothetical protein [Cytophagales bacterium]